MNEDLRNMTEKEILNLRSKLLFDIEQLSYEIDNIKKEMVFKIGTIKEIEEYLEDLNEES